MTPTLSSKDRLTLVIEQNEDLRAENADLRRRISAALQSGLTPRVRQVLSLVAAEWDVDADLILSERRAAWIVEPRQVAMWIAAKHLRHSLPRIGSALRRDHTTVLHGIGVVSARLARDPDFAARVARVSAAVTTQANPEVQ
ncbi:hypothetical protein KPL78_19050 [Roseomonas sp. HJA6]|uniref:Chromosomal replication initiator DnaA C-terminal domain-containing protein n=1 Tax=Roseomonas alba TaxID=2846776 RepID=A0ABS7AB64_9PROT|nr:helix-turn-helix domain-containing protein [Neoroseomonas alba]MBW6399532.1 hypothetical protein [Neoroseomonas alba]MBW6399966.1 hypothetical protein [Neoroseomonas alba]